MNLNITIQVAPPTELNKMAATGWAPEERARLRATLEHCREAAIIQDSRAIAASIQAWIDMLLEIP